MIKVYGCVTLYHVFVSLMMAKNDSDSAGKKVNSIFVLNANNPIVHADFLDVAKKLSQQGFTVSVRLRSLKDDFTGKTMLDNRKQFNELVSKSPDIKQGYQLINFAWNNSYIYTTVNVLYKNCTEALFIEESALIARMGVEAGFKKTIHRMKGGIVDYYKDAKIKSILVQNPETFVNHPKEFKNKLGFLYIAELMKKLSEKSKTEIVSTFIDAGLLRDLEQSDNFGIIYSAPFSQDRIIDEELKIKYFMKMCDYYRQYGRVIFKLHPRDNTKYPITKDVVLLPGNFPSEIISLLGKEFLFAVSITSSAVITTNAKHKLNLNDNFLKDKIFELKPLF
jgi:hypothetical protein